MCFDIFAAFLSANVYCILPALFFTTALISLKVFFKCLNVFLA